MMNFLSPDPDSVLRPRDLVEACSDPAASKPEDLLLEKLAVVTFTRPDFERIIKHAGEAEEKRVIRSWGSGRNRIFRGQGWVAVESRIGAPNVVILLEELAAFGVERTIFLGYCGSLHEKVRIGDVVLADGALREEGTSYHYLEEGRPALPDLRLQEELSSLICPCRVRLHRGTIWTTDAPYRETGDKVARYRDDGILGVEMEMAAAFVFGMVRKISVGALLLVSDQLLESGWRQGFPSPGLRKARDVVLDTLSSHLPELIPLTEDNIDP
jgi:uridine phosphorylase